MIKAGADSVTFRKKERKTKRENGKKRERQRERKTKREKRQKHTMTWWWAD